MNPVINVRCPVCAKDIKVVVENFDFENMGSALCNLCNNEFFFSALFLTSTSPEVVNRDMEHLYEFHYLKSSTDTDLMDVIRRLSKSSTKSVQ